MVYDQNCLLTSSMCESQQVERFHPAARGLKDIRGKYVFKGYILRILGDVAGAEVSQG